ncbi:MAG: DUF4199 domain-containing protein [Sphingobacteriales bacterium]|nr:DUF4199 domain-containing protein [Sphingobacteriales bacterium]
MEKKVTSHVTKGLILALVLIVVDVAATVLNIKYETWFKWLPTLFFCIVIIWACINYANQMDNNVTFGNVFVHGFKTSAVIACIMVLYVILSIFVLFPDQIDKVLDVARKQMEEKNLPESNIDQGIAFTKKLYVPFAIGGAVIGSLLVGAIASLIGGAIAKKNPPSPFQQQA